MAEDTATMKEADASGAGRPASAQALSAVLLDLVRLLARQAATESIATKEED